MIVFAEHTHDFIVNKKYINKVLCNHFAMHLKVHTTLRKESWKVCKMRHIHSLTRKLDMHLRLGVGVYWASDSNTSGGSMSHILIQL